MATAGFIGCMVFDSFSDGGTVGAIPIVVDSKGGGDYTTIQAAIDAANSGATINVWAGTYNENIRITKTLTLIGNGTTNTTIEGVSFGKDVVFINADYVNISGFNITNLLTSNWDYAGVKVTFADNCRIIGNNISRNNGCGIYLFSKNTLIANNTLFFNKEMGLRFNSGSSNTIINNTFTRNNYGSYLMNTYRNRFDFNTISHNDKGIVLSQASSITFDNNTFIGNGISIFLPSITTLLQYWNSHTINTSNTVNGKPVYYLANENSGTVPEGAGQVLLGNCSGVTVQNQEINNTDTGIALGFSSNNHIINNVITNSSERGIDLYSSDDNFIQNNTIMRNNITGIGFRDSNTNYLADNFICENRMYGLQLLQSNTNRIINSNLSNNSGGIILSDSLKNIVKNNVVSWNNYSGISTYDSDDALIIGNTVHKNNNNGISIGSSDRNVIDKNIITLNKQEGLNIQNSHTNRITNSNLSSNGNSGLYLIWSQSGDNGKNVIENNIFNKNLHGLRIYQCSENRIINNTVNGNSGDGIYIHLASSTKIQMNTVSGNGNNGIYQYSAYSNDISGNSVSKNQLGITLTSWGSGNLIYHNNIVSNTLQGSDQSNNNKWYYNNEGNYWSDYTGLDNGANGRTAYDGIGDTKLPHNRDNYPFISFNGWILPPKPTLYGPFGIITDGIYGLGWPPAVRTDGYILEEAKSATFTSPVVIYNGPVNEFNITGKPDGTYYYRVKCYNSNSHGEWSNTLAVEVNYPPSPPTGLIFEDIKGGEVTLKWNPNSEPDMESYNVFINESDAGVSGPYRKVNTKPVLTNEFTVTGLVDKMIYHFVVTALDNKSIESTYSDTATASTLDVEPDAPTGLKAKAVSGTQIQLSWNQNVESDLAGYKIFMNDTGSGSGGPYHQIKEFDILATLYIVTGLREQTEYYFVIQAFDIAGQNSIFSKEASSVTPDETAPLPPKGLAISNETHEGMTLRWKANVEDDLVNYLVYRSKNPYVEFRIVEYVPSDIVEYIDHHLTELTIYYYAVTAVDDVGLESEFSLVVPGTTLIGQRPPKTNSSGSKLYIKEDTYDDSSLNLYDLFKDPNHDELFFECTGQNKIKVTIYQENGTVAFKPELNWNGNETITFSAEDGISAIVFHKVSVYITPVNDPPGEIFIFEPENYLEVTKGTIISFSSLCNDPDLPYGDEITYNWFSSLEGKIGSRNNFLWIPVEPGTHVITLTIFDKIGLSNETKLIINLTSADDSKPMERGDEKSNKAIIGGSIAFALILVILILLLLLRRRRGKEEDTDTKKVQPTGQELYAQDYLQTAPVYQQPPVSYTDFSHAGNTFNEQANPETTTYQIGTPAPAVQISPEDVKSGSYSTEKPKP